MPNSLFAQQMTVNTIRSNNPIDTNYQDLSFLKNEIANSNIVFLGEATHGEGQIISMNTRITKFLIEKMGFNTVAFESGFYDIHQANLGSKARGSRTQELRSSLFPIWTETSEFQQMFNILENPNIEVIGFDPQFSSNKYKKFIPDLYDFLNLDLGSSQIGSITKRLEILINSMGEFYQFPKQLDIKIVKEDIDLILKMVTEIKVSNKKKASTADFWLHSLKGIKALAIDYAINNPNNKGEKEFQAKDSNIRDSIMASNLIYYLKQNPNIKVICWGASTHFIKKTKTLRNNELRQYHPMGSLVSDLYGNKVFSIAPISLSGEYGNLSVEIKHIPESTENSLEAKLKKVNAENFYVSTRIQELSTPINSSVLEYKEVTAIWKDLFDGFFVFKKVSPPEYYKLKNKVAKDLPISSSNQKVHAKIVSSVDSVGVSFCSVKIKSRGISTVTDINGDFEFDINNVNNRDSLEISSIGYRTKIVSVQEANNSILRLSAEIYTLATVEINSNILSPVAIVERAIKNIATNYDQSSFQSDYYTRASSTNFDTLFHDVEYVGTVYNPKGYQNPGNLDYISGVKEIRWLQKPKLKDFQLIQYSFSTKDVNRIDLINDNPLFSKVNLKNYDFKLKERIIYEGKEAYSIDFSANKTSNNVTGQFYISSFLGNLIIDANDFAIVEANVKWEKDTVTLNRLTKQYFDADGPSSRKIWHDIYEFVEISQTSKYVKDNNGKYYISKGKIIWYDKRKDIMYNQDLKVRAVLDVDFMNHASGGAQPVESKNIIWLKDIPQKQAFWDEYYRKK